MKKKRKRLTRVKGTRRPVKYKKTKVTESSQLPFTGEPASEALKAFPEQKVIDAPPKLEAEFLENPIDEYVPVAELLPPTLVPEHSVAATANENLEDFTEPKLEPEENPSELETISELVDSITSEDYSKKLEILNIFRSPVAELPERTTETVSGGTKEDILKKKKKTKKSSRLSVAASPYMSGPIYKTATAAHTSVSSGSKKSCRKPRTKSNVSQSPRKVNKKVPAWFTRYPFLEHNYSAAPSSTVTDNRRSVEKVAEETAPLLKKALLPPPPPKISPTSLVEPDRPATNNTVSVHYGSHYTALQHALSGYFTSERFSDVTLVSQEGRFVKCHKVILSACSEFMDKLLSNLTSFYQFQHPVIFLRNVPFAILDAICKFMYVGQVDVMESDLDFFVKIAESLKIKGLISASSESSVDVIEEKKEQPPSENIVIRKITKKQRAESSKIIEPLKRSHAPAEPKVKRFKKTTATKEINFKKKTEPVQIPKMAFENHRKKQEQETENEPEIAYSYDQFFNMEDEVKTELIDIEYTPLLFNEKEERNSDTEMKVSTIKDEEEETPG